jgi:hypothetical protein
MVCVRLSQVGSWRGSSWPIDGHFLFRVFSLLEKRSLLVIVVCSLYRYMLCEWKFFLGLVTDEACLTC